MIQCFCKNKQTLFTFYFLQNGIYLVSLSTSVSVLISGFILPLNSYPLLIKWLCLIAYTRYGFQTFILALYKNRETLNCSESFCLYHKPSRLIQKMEIDGNIYFAFLVMVSTICALRILALFMLQSQILHTKQNFMPRKKLRSSSESVST